MCDHHRAKIFQYKGLALNNCKSGNLESFLKNRRLCDSHKHKLKIISDKKVIGIDYDDKQFLRVAIKCNRINIVNYYVQSGFRITKKHLTIAVKNNNIDMVIPYYPLIMK